jgi:hypothetical protein
MNMGNMREISIEECMRVSGGGKITELYVDKDGVWLVTHDENGNFLYEVKLSNGAGGGWDGGGSSSTDGGWYGGGWIAGLTGASVSGGGDQRHADWLLGLGGGYNIGYC